MDYSEYTVEDFVADPVFIEWVLTPTPGMDLYWENWASDHPGKMKDIQDAREIIVAFKYKKFQWREDRKKKIWSAIERINEQNDDHGAKSTIGARIKPVFKWAAVLIGILLMSVFTINRIEKQSGETKEIAPSMIRMFNPEGQKSKIFLPDGSTVYLNGGSTLSYLPGFSKDRREIILSGEGYFEVTKDVSRPFVVIANKLITTALGTTFSIKAYQEDHEVLISLLTGQVSVQQQNSADPVLVLYPREAAGLNHEEGILTQREFNYEQNILWKDGILYFKETYLEEAFKRLEKWYGVSFNLQNQPPRTIVVTGEFDNENLNNVLLSLSYTSHFTYSIENGEVIISFK